MKKPDEAWRKVITHLQMEMPKATFDERVREARFVSFENGVFTIGVTDAFTRDWLESRLTRMIERQLIGALNTGVQVRFVVEERQNAEKATIELPESSIAPFSRDENIDDAQDLAEIIRPIQTDLHKIISRPHARTVIPAYLLRWLPYIGPDGGWFLVAMYQAFYFSQNERLSQTNKNTWFRVNRNWLCTWSGLGTNKVAQLLESTSRPAPANFLAWFIKGSKPARGRAREYCFQVDMPLTPGDIEALTKWLVDNGIHENPVGSLEKAINTPSREIIPFPVPPPAAHHYNMAPNPITVIELVHNLSGSEKTAENYQQISALARQLQTNILHPNDNLHITHYFLCNWVHRLRPGPAWVVMILRDKGFQDTERGILRDRVRSRNGYQELAAMLGVTEERISDWLPPLEDRVRRRKTGGSPKRSWRYQQTKRQQIVNFVLAKTGAFDTGGKQATQYEFRIRLDDPLIPEHASIAHLIEAILFQRLQTDNSVVVDQFLAILEKAIDSKRLGVDFKQPKGKTYQKPGVESKQLPTPLEWNLNNLATGWSGLRAGLDNPAVEIKQLLEWTPDNIKASLKLFNLKVLYEIQQLLLQPCSQQSKSISADEDEVVEVWTIDLVLRLLAMGGVAQEKLVHYQKLLESQPEKLSSLVGWILYGYVNRTNHDHRGIDAPEFYALSRFEECAPQPVYLAMAQKPPGELLQVLQHPYSRPFSKDQKQILGRLYARGFLDVLMALGAQKKSNKPV